MKNSDNAHISVLLKELVEGLDIKEGNLVVDATVNGGGMSKEILRRFGNKVKLTCLDADENALKEAQKTLTQENQKTTVSFVCGNFSNLKNLLKPLGISAVDKIIFDLGLSSNQLESSGRGFSFLKDEPLLMTFSAKPTEEDLTAFDIANRWDAENIETILKSYGQEWSARKIAGAIVEARKDGPIKTSKQLSEIVEKTVGRRGKIHPATKTFQAFRIAVNDELLSLKEGLKQGFEFLNPGGRMALISFHSAEDRIVKNFMKDRAKEKTGIVIFKKPITPGKEELTKNPRARSAKLRILEKI